MIGAPLYKKVSGGPPLFHQTGIFEFSKSQWKWFDETLTQNEFHNIADESMFRNDFQLKHYKTTEYLQQEFSRELKSFWEVRLNSK